MARRDGFSADAGPARRGRLDGAYLVRLKAARVAIEQLVPPPEITQSRGKLSFAHSFVKVTKFRENKKAVAQHVRYLLRYKDPMEMDDGTTTRSKSTAMMAFSDSLELPHQPPTPKMRDYMDAIARSKGILVQPADVEHISAAAKWINTHVPENKQIPLKKTRVAVSLVVSSPRGTNPERVRAAAREFGRHAFGDEHRWGFVVHTNTEAPHAHFVVATRSRVTGKSMDVNKSVLNEWRRIYARAMTQENVPMVTKRWYEKWSERPSLTASASRGSYRANARGELDLRTRSLIDQVARTVSQLRETTERLQGAADVRSSYEKLRQNRLAELPKTPPSEKTIKLAERIAKRKGVELSPEQRGSIRAISAFIDEHQEPTKRQAQALNRLEERIGHRMSDADRQVRSKVNDFMTAHNEGPSDNMVNRVAAQLGYPPTDRMKGALDRLAAEKQLDVPDAAYTDARAARDFLNEHSDKKMRVWTKEGRIEQVTKQIARDLEAREVTPASQAFLDGVAARSGDMQLAREVELNVIRRPPPERER